ncbi:MAG: DUF4157 domain-containing protein [Gemmatimonadales bacterium]
MAIGEFRHPKPPRAASRPVEHPGPRTPHLATASVAGLPLFISHRRLSESVVQAMLEVGRPDDQFEHEADRVADAVVGAAGVADPPAAPGSPPSVQRRCAECASGTGACPACEEEDARGSGSAVQRKAESSAAPPLGGVTGALPGRGGNPLPAAVRAGIEPVLRSDLRSVRIHDDPESREAARSLNAKAFTHGDHIWLGAGQSSYDLRLIAHEATHVLQQTGGKTGAGRLQRDPSDDSAPAPESTRTWEALGTLHRLGDEKAFMKNLSAAPAKDLALESELASTPEPKTDAGREQLVRRIRMLIRLRALGSMAAHRATIEARRDELFTGPTGTPAKPQPGKGGPGAKQSPAPHISDALRAAATEAQLLQQRKVRLSDSALLFDRLSGDAIRADRDEFADLLQRTTANADPYKSDRIREFFARANAGLASHQASGGKIDRGFMTAFTFNMARYLADWRRTQVKGLGVALGQVYEAFPFFGVLKPEEVHQDWTEGDFQREVRKAYTELLKRVDQAIVEIGSEDIDPFDLPAPVQSVKQSLNAAQRSILEKTMQDREVKKFWINMGLALAMAVFLPVLGPAGLVIGAAVGAAQLALDVEDALDRLTVSEASASPEGDLLGVSAPSKFEWAMLGVQAALIAADVRGAWQEINASRPHFKADPRGGAHPGAADLHPTEAPTQDLGTLPKGSAADAGAKTLSGEERTALDATRNVEGVPLTSRQLDTEFGAVSHSPRRPSKVAGFEEEVELPNGHVWRKRGSQWCRWSGDRVCYLGKDVSGGNPRVTAQADFTPGQSAWHDRIAEKLEAHDLDWRDAGFHSERDVLDFFNRYDSVDDALTALEARTDFAVEKRLQVLGEVGKPHPPGARPVPAQKSAVKRSHDLGAEGGTLQASEHGIGVRDWNNPRGHIGDYGRGLDAVGDAAAGKKVILEWKGGGAQLSQGQMREPWVGRKLAELGHENDPIAAELMTACRNGKLEGRVYRTREVGGRLDTELTELPIAYDYQGVFDAFLQRWNRLRPGQPVPAGIPAP